MKTKQPWQAALKKLKLKHLENTAPSFYQASGGLEMLVKPYSEKTDTALAGSISACLKFCGFQTEVIRPYKIQKGLRGDYRPVFEEAWKPIKIIGKKAGCDVLVEIDKRKECVARSGVKDLYFRTNSFESFSNWFVLHFPNSPWAMIDNCS